MDAHTQASQKKVIQAYYSPEGKSGYIRAYAKTGPNTATLQVLEFNDNGAQLAALLAKYADQLTPQQISHLLSIVLADGHCTEMSLTFTSPTTATATTLSLSDGETEQTIRHINITLVDTLPAEENMEQTSADEQGHSEARAKPAECYQ